MRNRPHSPSSFSNYRVTACIQRIASNPRSPHIYVSEQMPFIPTRPNGPQTCAAIGVLPMQFCIYDTEAACGHSHHHAVIAISSHFYCANKGGCVVLQFNQNDRQPYSTIIDCQMNSITDTQPLMTAHLISINASTKSFGLVANKRTN